MTARIAEPLTSYDEAAGLGLSREELLGVYRHLLLTRGVEERGHILYKQGKVPGSFYSGRGNEGAAVATAMALGPNDAGTPTQRDMGVHIVRGLEPWRILAQYMGRAGGVMRGRDGNVHMANTDDNMVPMVSHMGAMMPVAVGMALAIRIRGERRVAVTWFGDGASARGDVHESMNFAGVRRLPVVFICDNNQWAYSTPSSLEYAVEHIANRAEAYGFEGVVVDGTDLLTVYREAKLAVDRARDGGGPTLLECVTLRMEGHGAHDPATYIPRALLQEWAGKDPIDRYRAWLLEEAAVTDEEEANVAEAVRRQLNEAVRLAEESSPAHPSDPLHAVYADSGPDA